MKRIILITMLSILIIIPKVLGLSFQTVTAQIDQTYDVRAALLEVERLQKEIAALMQPEDHNFSLNPSIKAITQEDGAFGEEIELTGSASIKIPLCLSDIEKEKLDYTLLSLRLAETAVATSRQKAFIKLYNLYQSVWLLQEEEAVLELEVNAAENYVEMLQQRFEAGSVSLITLAAADETLQERYDNYGQNLLKQKLSWFELMFTTGLDMEREILEKSELNVKDIPKPPELKGWIKENHPLVEIERVKLQQLQQTIERMIKPDLDISIKPFFNSTGNEYTASINYNFSDPELTPSVSFPVYTSGEITSGGSSSISTWNTGVTVNISLGSNRSDRLNAAALELELESAEVKFDFLIESLNLVLRSSYQQLMRNQEALEQAERNLVRSTYNQKIIEAKNELGQTSKSELLESESLVERARWKIHAARIDTERSWLAVVENAAWFEKVELNN